MQVAGASEEAVVCGICRQLEVKAPVTDCAWKHPRHDLHYSSLVTRAEFLVATTMLVR